jgi:hypothetical protein
MSYQNMFIYISMFLFIIFIQKTLNIEHFVEYSPFYYQNKINSQNIFNNTILLTNNDTEGEQIEKLLNTNSVNKVIKYIDGMKWKKWNKNVTQNVKNANDTAMKTLQTKLKGKYKIEINKINRYRENQHSDKIVIIETDILVDFFHFNVLYYSNFAKNEIVIILCKLIGRIKETELYENELEYYNINDENNDYVLVENKLDKRQEFVKDEDIQSEKHENIKVIDLIYNKFMEDINEEEDVIKHIFFKRNHDFIQKLFLNNLNKNDKTYHKYKEIQMTDEYIY